MIIADGRARLRAAVAKATTLLRAAEIDSPEVNALRLAEHVAGVRPVLTVTELADDFEARYFRLVGERAAHIPLQLLTGTAAFRYLEVAVEPGVFIPRPETELVAGAAIAEAESGKTRPLVVDLCTGTGVIALSVATEVSGAQVIAVDLSAAAVDLARRNAATLGADIDVRQGDVADPALLVELDGTVDVLVANPPYVPAGEIAQPEVREHDPQLALFGGGPDGLAVPADVIAAAARLLRAGGLLVMEHDVTQGAAVRKRIAATAAFDTSATHQDLTGRDRYVTARRL